MNNINRLKDLRNDLDLTQAEFSKLINEQTTTYARWEQNPYTMKAPAILKLAKFHNVSVDYLLGLTNDKRKYW